MVAARTTCSGCRAVAGSNAWGHHVRQNLRIPYHTLSARCAETGFFAGNHHHSSSLQTSPDALANSIGCLEGRHSSSNERLPVTNAWRSSGAGTLYDVPLDALAKTFERVELIDIIRRKEAHQIAAAYPNVTFRNVDISGTSRTLAAMPHRATEAPSVGALPIFAPETDLVISVNLVSQLAKIPQEWLQVRTGVTEDDRRAFRAEVRDLPHQPTSNAITSTKTAPH
jgi:hypothetical protein